MSISSQRHIQQQRRNVLVEKARRLGWLYRRHSVAAQRNVLLSRAILAIEFDASRSCTFAYAEVDRIRNSVGKISPNRVGRGTFATGQQHPLSGRGC